MVELMRGRVAVDSDLRLSGVTYAREGGMWVVRMPEPSNMPGHAILYEAMSRTGPPCEEKLTEKRVSRAGFTSTVTSPPLLPSDT